MALACPSRAKPYTGLRGTNATGGAKTHKHRYMDINDCKSHVTCTCNPNQQNLGVSLLNHCGHPCSGLLFFRKDGKQLPPYHRTYRSMDIIQSRRHSKIRWGHSMANVAILECQNATTTVESFCYGEREKNRRHDGLALKGSEATLPRTPKPLILVFK